MYKLCFNFSLVLMAVINGPAKRLLLQIGVKKRRGRDVRTFCCLIYFFAPFFRIFISFRKPCHMLLPKFIPPFIPTLWKEHPRNNTPGLSPDRMTVSEFSSLGKEIRNTPREKEQLISWLKGRVMKNRQCQSKAQPLQRNLTSVYLS